MEKKGSRGLRRKGKWVRFASIAGRKILQEREKPGVIAVKGNLKNKGELGEG